MKKKREELVSVVTTADAWFDKDEVIYVVSNDHQAVGAEYATIRDSQLRPKGYTISKENIRFLTKETHPEYFL